MSDFYGYDPNDRIDRWRQSRAAKTNRVAIRNSLPGAMRTGGPGRLPEDVIQRALLENTETSGRNFPTPTDPSGANLGGNKRFTPPPAPEPPSFLDQLLEGITAQYQGPANRGMGMEEQINAFKQGLDNALTARLQALGGVRDNAQKNFNTSDANLAAMYQQNANHIATQGSQAYRNIAAEHQKGLIGSRDSSVKMLQDDRAKQVAERAAMLKNLGLEASAGAPNPVEETLSRGIQSVVDRSNINQNMANKGAAANQAFNQSVVNSVNQQGAERRAALMQQLQAIQNQLSMAEAEARSETERAKASGVFDMQKAYASAPDNSYEVFRDRQNNLMDIYKLMVEQQGREEDSKPAQVRGFGGLAQDLLNSGIPESQAAGYMNALSNVLSSEYMQGIHPDQGYDRASIIARRLVADYNVPQVIAGQLATNYANLGNNAYFTAQ